MSKGQYACNGEMWFFCGETTKRLEAGIYKTCYTRSGDPALSAVTIKTDSPVDIPGSVAEKVSKELTNFWSKRKMFSELGVLHKRGILLYGAPGTGKTSTACSIARSVVAEGGIVLTYLPSERVQLLQTAIQKIREREEDRQILVLIEDVDEMIENGQEEDLLALLDGENQVDHIAYVATTNTLKQVGDRLSNRPCRFDLVLEMGLPSEQERLVYLRERIKDAKLAQEWAKDTDGLSLAHLRELIVGVKCMGENKDAVLKRLRGMATRAADLHRKREAANSSEAIAKRPTDYHPGACSCPDCN